ncbi:hypothetical protein KSY51_15755 [Erysipelatoclostridium ramosum]|uniref:Uncharacterized protein n=1 Tax=Thomasclavelia ramosa DSM 1402 TaxID=445974 RepID=B0N8U9_9FIRM|nr:hypothetical protein [Thomasclavelia ramosa]EDS17106.1 hypothetical protein CLORAM_03080 [Thomasclavelia ramosa DSM 1402]MBU9904904.1 hypothetical protein [Thomasclavelia ramosa]MBV4094949.1 hypothetical protein [Thomasclavelia ramosa]MBV4109546.1 hypothetical protein [Thomasclavelia ramosa]MBV4112706.1 hypothetical protein [Thomasclavelia ramosa]
MTNPVNANVVKHTFQIDGDGYGTLQIAHTLTRETFQHHLFLYMNLV